MKLSSYIAKRTVYVIFTLIGLSVLVFVIARVLPGDPARMAAGPRAPEWVIEQLRIQLRLDKPLYEQYFYWVGDVVRGDLGYSITSRRSLTIDVLEYLPASLELILLAAIFEVVGAFTLGVIAGRYSYKWPDNLVRVFSYVGISIPSFVWAIILLLLFAWMLPLFPTQGLLSYGVNPPPTITGMTTLDSLITGRVDAFLNVLWHMVLPALALCVGGMMQDARIIRAGMVENQDKDYITMASSQGLPERLIMFKYLLKPSVIPAVTVMGMDIAALLANAFLVERVYNWPGFSKFGITAMLNKDLNAIVALVLVIGVIYAIVNIAVDAMVAYLDPRIRLMERGE
ncbi:MAG: ABC transporter permease subunit [Nitrososphaeria archaeon]|nr:ABC transporter permease subunit [Nitrososphaeria archaeon]